MPGGVISHQFVQGSRSGGVRGAPASARGSGRVSCLSSHIFAASRPGLSVRPAQPRRKFGGRGRRRSGLNPGGPGMFPASRQPMRGAVPPPHPHLDAVEAGCGADLYQLALAMFGA
ncbi:hypothetical protein NDU88_001836 [Pleurodeles waltl]|uniref:Uncharacterized protein n=1 Tax=Pleurodeles waltl TaxID=8319 RepID=A0AAV7UTY9_PLEWA|nr:hypothetical protein NDU88_001836 [Pleurodeles waltl]